MSGRLNAQEEHAKISIEKAHARMLGLPEIEPQPTSEIGQKFDSLGAAIDNLYGSICQLNQRLSAVMASEAPTPASEGQTKQAQTSCYMASYLDSLRNRVNESSVVLHSILNRLAL